MTTHFVEEVKNLKTWLNTIRDDAKLGDYHGATNAYLSGIKYVVGFTNNDLFVMINRKD